MLVLTRKESETIVIDGQIEVSVIEVRGNRVKLGVKAPASVRVKRDSLVIEPRKNPIECHTVQS